LNSKDYIEWTRQYWLNGGGEGLEEFHAVFGIGSEAGELADLYKKQIRTGETPRSMAVADEVGDMFYYIARLLDEHKFTFEEVMLLNQVKLDYRMNNEKDKEKERQLQIAALRKARAGLTAYYDMSIGENLLD
jgi:NTP pyrophosphatase (non-canonical NTP hydrolase)